MRPVSPVSGGRTADTGLPAHSAQAGAARARLRRRPRRPLGFGGRPFGQQPAFKLRWRIEHDYREMKQALGLAHFEDTA
ncbi:hypothetical protein QFZ63_000264 [Streptomyces sp. B3I7]|uniref:hypothetical protein n=1 Tax=Streptomyces sp. B3I7 TaxID=3042269 RepID=UPI002789A1C7|nr:hypothetical protein [Streptomyces sp. B3I7]MDQ0808550.1 hypothetical protein [Streptomyces sp. B3I7]